MITQIRLILLVGTLAILSTGAYLLHQSIEQRGYDRCQLETSKANTMSEANHAKELQERQDQIGEVELELLSSDIGTVTLYADRKIEVIKEVTKYVKDTNSSSCNVGPNGMLIINQALSGATASSDPE